MPIPTDTYRNIRVLNWVFAATALLLLGVMGLSVVQDFFKTWRKPQMNAQVWEAALVQDKLQRALTPEKKAALARIDAQLKEKEKQIEANRDRIDQLRGQIAKVRSDIATREFRLNNDKASLTVMESHLEEARTEGLAEEVRDLERRIRAPRQQVAEATEQVKAWQADVERLNAQLAPLTKERDALEKEKTRLEADQKALRKKKESLEPDSLAGKLSALGRRVPLMQFINPSEKVTQDVLPDVRTDVAFQKITTIDRCRTCHVNIEDKAFTEENVLAFLERSVAEERKLNLPVTRAARATDPQATADQPGAAAMGEFWHAWAAELSPAAVKRNAARIKTLTDTVGKTAAVTVDGRKLASFAYNPSAADDATNRQDDVMAELVKAWSKVDKAAVTSASADGKVRVEIAANAPNAATVRAAALKYPEDARAALTDELDKEQRRMLLDRYRRALVAEVNAARRGDKLDDGRVMLAHPQLDLYVGVDSKHSYEKVGCTSCHDGSGQETDFVLAAHTARAIWVDQRTGAPVLPAQLVNPPEEHHAPTMASMLEAVYPHDVLAPLDASSLHMPFASAAKDAGHHAAQAPTGADKVQLASADQHEGAAAAAASSSASSGHTSAQSSPSTTARRGAHARSAPPPDDARPVQYLDPVTGKAGRAVPQIQYWASQYERESGDSFETVHHRWDWPMRAPEFIEANCVRCHTQVTDIREKAPTLNEGRTLFANLGCANCHQMDSIPAEQKRQVGTDLRHVTEKLSPAFINTWVWAPKAFRPSTKMPHFFMLENNSSDEELRRTRQEARAITEYLVRTATPMLDRHQLPQGGKGSAEAGRLLFETVGCQGCHVNLNAPTRTKGVTVGQQWITQDLIKGGKLAAQLEQVVAREVAERMTRDVESTVQKTMETTVTRQVTDAVTKELTPKRPANAPKATKEEQDQLKAQIAAEVAKRLPAEMEKAKKGLPAAVEKARNELPAAIDRAIPTELTKRVASEAQAIYDRMTYNERQLYVTENLEPTTVLMQPEVPLPGKTADKSIYDLPAYPDGTPRPVFMHHGPELSGIGTKLLAGRTPEQARAWLFSWLREPHHYSSYTLMPNLRLTDQQALDLVEYLISQTREANKPGDAWKAEVTPEDPAKLSELVAFFLRSRFSIKTAEQKAVEEFVTDGQGKQSAGEVTKLAIEALTTPVTPKDEAAQKVQQLNLAQKQMVWLGKKLISHYGCMSCHQINGMETATSPCANLSDWGQKGLDKLDFAYLDAHKAHSLPDTYSLPMVNGLSEKAAVLVHSGFSPDGSAKVSQAVSVAWPHVGHSREDWITQKLKNSRVYDRGRNLLDPSPQRRPDGQLESPGRPYDKLRMPTFYLSERQVQAIVTFVISNRDRLVTDTIMLKATTDEAKQIAYGRYLTQKYNCVSCHQTERNAPPVQQYYAREDITTKAPPSLRGEGNKIRHDWLFNFLRNVEPLRPLPQIRMPSFHFDSDAEVSAIAAYFASVSNREARELKKNIDLVQAHIDGPKKAGGAAADAGGVALQPATTQPATTQAAPSGSAKTQAAAAQPAGATPPATGAASAAASAAPRTPWYVEETLEAARRYLEWWALNYRQLTPLQLDPARNTPAEMEKNYATLLFKAKFTQELYNAPYPFTDASRPNVTDDRLELGKQLFFEMQCLKCHMFGELKSGEKVPSSVVAPNLGLAHARLQRRWVRHWIQEPPIIQVGTAMPPFLSGLAALKLDGLSWPRSQMLPEPEIQRIEARYGASPDEQAKLVLDFIYSSGARNLTVTQPAAGAAGGPSPLPQGQPPTATQPASAGNPAIGSPANADVNKAPVQPGTNVIPPEKKQEMTNPQKPAVPPVQNAPAPAPGATDGAKPQATAPAASPTAPMQKTAPPAPAPSAPAQPAGPASVTGKVIFKGQAPEPEQIDMAAVKECAAQHPDGAFAQNLVVGDNGALKNVVVKVTGGLPDQKPPPPSTPAKLDQKGCQYNPHVIAVMVGQPLLISNSDNFLHNVHSLAEQNPAFNFGQPSVDAGRPTDPVKTPEVFKVKCDVHPWMNAWVHVLDHPYFSVTGADGSFTLSGLPPGKYTLTAWHETLGERTAEVTVEAGKPANAEFTFEAGQ